MRTITLELLRHGPAHNQLLSPLTQYLALCENHSAVTFHVPFEHNQFLHRLRALGYAGDAEARAFQLRDTGRVLGDLLGGIPGVVAELNRDPPPDHLAACRPRDLQRTTHLRLVVSASELALLPFELAVAPTGCPGEGQHLLLESEEPVCITREVRRVPQPYGRWTRKPRILFAAAAPPLEGGRAPPIAVDAMGRIPFERHLAELTTLVEPWVGYWDTDAEHEKRIAEQLVVLKNASAEEIGRICKRQRITHVHLLAHGVQYREGADIRFGLALHDARDPGKLDVVSGDRLATMLRPSQEPAWDGLARPVAVTLASCDSGNVGGVAGVGASVAHALHDAGIPVVIASQFPLSFDASVLMARVLYEGLLWCEDVRLVLNDLRRRLHSEHAGTHDWASLTAYASLPPDIERTLLDAQITQASRAIDVALSYADRATDLCHESCSREAAQAAGRVVDVAERKVDAAKKRLEKLVDRAADQRARVHGLLASTDKRRAEMVSCARPVPEVSKEVRAWLRSARRNYRKAFVHDASNAWAAVQLLSLDLVLARLKREPGTGVGPEPDEAAGRGEQDRPAALWTVSQVLSLNDLCSGDPRRIAWAHGNLVELYLLAPMVKGLRTELDAALLRERAVHHARSLVDAVGEDAFEVYSTRRQVLRYRKWYAEIADLGDAVVEVVEQVAAVLPEPERTEWEWE